MLDRDVINDALRLFEGRAISAEEADRLLADTGSREEFLRELWVRRGGLARLPDVASLVDEARRARRFPGGRTEWGFYERFLPHLEPDRPTALYVPRWRGVAAATRYLFRQALPIPPAADQEPGEIGAGNIAAYADMLLATGIRHFVVSGGDEFHLQLIEGVLRQDRRIRFDLLWHSNYLQLGEETGFELFWRWIKAHQDGLITRFGVTKASLDGFLRQYGVDAVRLPQFVPIDETRRKPTAVSNVAGIWLSGSSSYRKPPHAMIAAVKAMRSFYLKGSGLGADGLALISALDVPFLEVSADPVPYERLLREIASTAVSLYVTISESEGLLPIESFSVGVPCLVGPGSHLFEDHEVLRQALVVEQPFNPGLIADMAIGVVERRAELLAAYRGYSEAVAGQMHAALARFLG